jgi:glutathione S-transferase
MFLHHYEASPFSEKPRALFGVKAARWRSVVQPVIMPKPELTPLTGGYRRIPVLQVGADIFLDTPLILAEIEARIPAPAAAGPLDGLLTAWSDRLFFQTTVALVFAARAGATPAAFIADREKLSGRKFDVAAMQAAAPLARDQWRAHAGFIEAGLAGRDFLTGPRAGLADVAAYMNVWWLSQAAEDEAERLLKGLDRVIAWRERLRALGHGERLESAPAEARAAARAAEPGPAPAHDPHDPSGLRPGEAVVLAADDYGRDPIAGRLVSASPARIVVAREDANLGRLHVHAPRLGYTLARAPA